MTETPGLSRDDPRRIWAAEELDIARDASRDAIRLHWLRQLARVDFLPSEPSEQAFELLDTVVDDARLHEPSAYRQHHELAMEQRVEEFAERFFQISVADRAKEFQALTEDASGAVRAAARLKTLERGIDVDPGPTGKSEPVDRLCRWFADIFVLPYPEQGRVIRQVVRATQDERAKWAITTRIAGRDRSDVIALVPRLKAILESGDGNQEQNAGSMGEFNAMAPVMGSPAGDPNAWMNRLGLPSDDHAGRQLDTVTDAVESVFSMTGRAGIYVVVILAMISLRTCASLTTRESRQPSPPRIENHNQTFASEGPFAIQGGSFH